mmetsp:Transcript_9352/g.13009  ORF Transcript_9352/g.13009 Transcript_9352/m.13009 type:complete len:250 (-) Transcript_9352:301-1050(-)
MLRRDPRIHPRVNLEEYSVHPPVSGFVRDNRRWLENTNDGNRRQRIGKDGPFFQSVNSKHVVDHTKPSQGSPIAAPIEFFLGIRRWIFGSIRGREGCERLHAQLTAKLSHGRCHFDFDIVHAGKVRQVRMPRSRRNKAGIGGSQCQQLLLGVDATEIPEFDPNHFRGRRLEQIGDLGRKATSHDHEFGKKRLVVEDGTEDFVSDGARGSEQDSGLAFDQRRKSEAEQAVEYKRGTDHGMHLSGGVSTVW